MTIIVNVCNSLSLTTLHLKQVSVSFGFFTGFGPNKSINAVLFISRPKAVVVRIAVQEIAFLSPTNAMAVLQAVVMYHVWPTKERTCSCKGDTTSTNGSLHHAGFEEILEMYPEMKMDFGIKSI